MNFPDPQDPDLVYSDSMAGDLFPETEADIRRFTAVFEHLHAAALSPKESTRLLTARIKAHPPGLRQRPGLGSRAARNRRNDAGAVQQGRRGVDSPDGVVVDRQPA